MIKSESLKNFAPALIAAQKKMGVALKDSKNPFYKSKYADLNSIIEAAIPTLNEEGIGVLQPPDVIEINGKQVVETMLLHTSGEYIISRMEVTPAKVNDPQAAGSATTYARRYALQSMVTLKATDDDAESAMGRKVETSKPAYKEVAKQAEVVVTKSDTLVVTIDAATVASNPEKKKVTFNRKPLSTVQVNNDDI